MSSHSKPYGGTVESLVGEALNDGIVAELDVLCVFGLVCMFLEDVL